MGSLAFLSGVVASVVATLVLILTWCMIANSLKFKFTDARAFWLFLLCLGLGLWVGCFIQNTVYAALTQL